MTDRQVRSDEARQNLRGLLNDVEHHDVRVTILRYGKPAAVIVPVSWYEEARALTAAQEQDTGSRP